MGSNTDGAQGDILIKLNRLEDQVNTLTMQLELNKETIAFLKATLSERDTYISELEEKLASAQQELEKSTLHKIDDLRRQIKNGIDDKMVKPVLGEIRRNVETLQGYVDQTRAVIKQKQQLLRENTQAAAIMIQRGPDQALRYLEQSIIEPARFTLHHIGEQTALRYAAAAAQLEEEVLKPGKLRYERLKHIAEELPSDIAVLFQMRVVEPLTAFINDMPRMRDEAGKTAQGQLRQVLSYNRKLLRQFIDFLSNEIKKSSFWDGKNRAASA